MIIGMGHNTRDWEEKIGNQRDWVWRGWKVRYTYSRCKNNQETLAGDKLANPPLLLLHGFGASIGHWRHNINVLTEKHTVYALDLLGFGASEKAIANYDSSFWVEQVYEFWQTFIGVPVILVGNSTGSLISLVAAATYPDMVTGLIMISLPDPMAQAELIPPKFLPTVEFIQNMVASPFLLRALFFIVRKPAVIRRWVKFAYYNGDLITDELVDILARPPRDRGAARAFCIVFKIMGSTKLGPSVKAVLPTLKVPILLIWGKQDLLIPPKLANPSQFTELNPRLELVELDNAGHCAHDECPEIVNGLILDWVVNI
ncbi:alpha/beta fold hydrolase [Okeania sp.]|uniref:alpha/beta fold hydrolase n=1 Tax=Okeania sp. TaxID=3100323 RepID=UPI002B4B338B|nr:alpha/beta fold hydrolase [Okeania sp.]MEB3341597.1 alpha/beta fold hydrolase [Okeania sp.]